MLPQLADIQNVQPQFLDQAAILGVVVITLICSVGGLVTSIISAATSRRALLTTQKRDVTLSDHLVERRELDELKRELTTERAAMNDVLKVSEQRSISLHNRINPIIENTAYIKGQMEGFGDAIRAFGTIAADCAKRKGLREI